jgi:cobalt-zinc-cadmium efflux system outer membrane protein
MQAPVPEPLTLDRALALADQYNPQLRAASSEIDVARGGILTARAHPNPDFNFLTGRQSELLPSAVSGRLDHFGFSQPIELPSVRRARIEAATLDRDSSELAESEARLNVHAQVKQAFYEVLRRKGELALSRENLRLVEDFRRRIEVQVNVGEAARLELTRAEAELATTRTLVRSAELRLTTGIAGLRAVVSGPLPESFEPQGELEEVRNLPPLDELRTEVLSRNPAVSQAMTNRRAAEARLEQEKALRKPQPSWILEVEKMPDLAFVRSGVVLTLPFWNRRKGQIAEAEARVQQADAFINLRRLELVTAVETAYGEYATATQQIASYQNGTLREAEAALNAAEAAFRFGERGIIDVLDAQRVLRRVRLDYLNAQYDREAALIEIERLRTNPLPRKTQ